MTLNCLPIKYLRGRIHLPASKSYSIRAHIIAACGGVSRIKHASDCEDAVVASKIAQQLKSLDPRVNRRNDRNGGVIPAKGPHAGHSQLFAGIQVFSVGESGTTLRFLLPLLSLCTKKAKVKGKGTLIGRPNAHLCATLRGQGMDIRGTGKNESVPIVYGGGKLAGGKMVIDGSLSSQFISALLIALPSLSCDSRLILTGKKLVSQDYILMTIKILARAGIVIKRLSSREYVIKGGQTFKGLKDFDVPSDYGLAAFLMAAAAILPSDINLQGNLDDRLPQSDAHILEFMKKMGVDLRKIKNSIRIKGPFQLKGGVFSLKNCPDLVPVMSILALFAKGKTKLIDIQHARAKESDRISDLRKELLKVGARVTETRDALTIVPKGTYKINQLLDSHQDHRLSMAFTVLGLKIGCRVSGIESCRKSYPAFIKDMKALGAAFTTSQVEAAPQPARL